jgi:hypothetical protein
MGCDLSKIDSVFTKHIKSLNDSIVKYANPDRKKIYIGIDNIMFLEMVTFISDIQFERHGYTLQPMINMEDLKIIKKWYRKNRKRLNWRKINDFFVLEKKMRHPPNFDIDEMEEYQEKLWIEMDLLHETNTFIDK